MLKVGSHVKVIASVDGRVGQRAVVTSFTPSGEFAELVYYDLSYGLVSVNSLQEITDGVENAAFTKPDDGEDCR